MSKNYYTLVTSLPHLPRFDQIDRIPITRERLLQRLKMLHPADYLLAEKAADFLTWRRQPKGRTDEEIVSLYKKNVEGIFESPKLKPLFEFSVNQRTIMTALRRKEKGLPPPKPEEKWGAGELVKTIQVNWEKPFFKLDTRFPWIVQAQTYLRSGELLKLEHLLMSLAWNKLDHLFLKNYFGFEAVIAYLLKWDIVQQWLAYNKSVAKMGFEELVKETINEYHHAN